MNDIEILENKLKQLCKSGKRIKIEDMKTIYAICETIQNLIQRNKNLEQILELMSKSLDNISYDQIPIAIEELKFKLQDLEQIEKEHKEENGRLRDELEKLSKLPYLCTPEIPQCQNGKYISYVDLVKKLEKKDKIIDKLITELTAVNSGRYEYMDNNRVLEIFINKVEEDIKE